MPPRLCFRMPTNGGRHHLKQISAAALTLIDIEKIFASELSMSK